MPGQTSTINTSQKPILGGAGAAARSNTPTTKVTSKLRAMVAEANNNQMK
jgi:hypothetical protein